MKLLDQTTNLELSTYGAEPLSAKILSSNRDRMLGTHRGDQREMVFHTQCELEVDGRMKEVRAAFLP